MGLLKSGWMQPVVEESTAADSEAETETQAETCCSRGPLEPDGPCGYEAEAFELLKTWPSLEAIEIHQCFPLSFGDMCTRTFGFAKDTGQFKGILKAVIHDVDELVYDEDAGGDVPLQFTIRRDFSKNEKRPARWCDEEEELDLPPY